LVAAEYILELPQQRRSFLELGCVLRTPHATTTANASEGNELRNDPAPLHGEVISIVIESDSG
jgi:hypothetical protein